MFRTDSPQVQSLTWMAAVSPPEIYSSPLGKARNQLDARAGKIQTALSAACWSEGSSGHLALFSQAIDSQHLDGSWGPDDSPRMKPCFTAQTIQMLWQLEIRQRLDEVPIRPTVLSIDSVQRGIAWLRSVQRDDGTWGEDVWDTCQVLKAFEIAGIPATDPNVAAGLSALRRNIDNDWPDRSSFWFGAGFLGGCLEVFNRYEDRHYSEIVTEQILLYYDDDNGYFHGLLGHSGTSCAPPEWHTACAISGFRSFGSVAPHRDKAYRAAHWLVGQQTKAGCWSLGHPHITEYCTVQAVIALASLSDTISVDNSFRGSESAIRGTNWLVGACRGSDAELATKLNAAAAIARTHPGTLMVLLPLSFVTEVNDVIKQYSVQASTLNSETNMAIADLRAMEGEVAATAAANAALSERLEATTRRASRLETDFATAHEVEHALRTQLASYALKLTANQLAVLGILITFFSALIGVLVSLFVGQQ
jgi:hypothetical protein